MPQDTNSGRIANEAGRRIARQIAQTLHMDLNNNSNECIYQGKKTVIKSAKFGNNRFGITKVMLGYIEQAIIAYQPEEDTAFQLYCVPISSIINSGMETRSKGASRGKVLNFNISYAIDYGQKIGEIKIDTTAIDTATMR